MRVRTILAAGCILFSISLQAQENKPASQPKQFISIAPISVGEEGLGMGIAYERRLDKGGYFSIIIPVSSPFIGYVNDHGTFGREFQTWRYTDTRQGMLQLSPGIKFYPVGNKGRARYALAALYHYQVGYRENTYYYYYNGSQTFRVDINKMAVMLQNSVNIFPTEHLYIGTELGLGYTFLNEQVSNGVLHRIGRDEVVQLAFRVGYRF